MCIHVTLAKMSRLEKVFYLHDARQLMWKQLNPTRRGFMRWPDWEEDGERIAETRALYGSVWQQSAMWGFGEEQ